MTTFMRAPRNPSAALPSLSPPCWKDGQPCPNRCANQLYSRVVHNQTPLHGAWAGWRMAGWNLVSPGGERIDPRTLDRWLWRQDRLYTR